MNHLSCCNLIALDLTEMITDSQQVLLLFINANALTKLRNLNEGNQDWDNGEPEIAMLSSGEFAAAISAGYG